MARTVHPKDPSDDRFSRGVAMAAGAVFLVFGAWAFLGPRSFFDAVAEFEPYNRHFIHDIGAFQIGLGATLVVAAFVRDGLVVALWGVGAGATVHVLSHVIDHDHGGRPESDIPLFAIVAALLLAAALMRTRRLRRPTD
jgi:hypothetical protein